MSRIHVPASKPEDWKKLLAEPERQWRTGYSAKTLAYCWQEANGIPECVKRVFAMSGKALFSNIEMLLAFPEYQVPLPPYGAHPSQNDLFVLAKGNDKLISIVVEGKVSEPFGDTVGGWRQDGSAGKQVRLAFLLDKLHLADSGIDKIRYQLLHRTASALILAERFEAPNALMLVHSFSGADQWFEDYDGFLTLFDLDGETNSLVGPTKVGDTDLYFAWVRGDRHYLER